MADNKKYYYLKLKEDFFDSDEMLLLQCRKFYSENPRVEVTIINLSKEE